MQNRVGTLHLRWLVVVLGIVLSASLLPGTRPAGALVAASHGYDQSAFTYDDSFDTAQTRSAMAADQAVLAFPGRASDPRFTYDSSGCLVATNTIRKGPILDEVPNNLPEQLALDSARAGNGEIIIRNLGDEARLIHNYGPGEWVKMQEVIRGTDSNIVVHWFRNLTTQLDVEFKFTSRYGR